MTRQKRQARHDRFARLRRIEQLDPQADFEEIYRLFMADFQSCTIPGTLEGFLFTFAAPRMSRILDASQQSEHHTHKRVVDTALLTAAVIEHGFGPGDGRKAARRVNEMHRQYDIHPDDFTAVGADVGVAQVARVEKFGWRPVTDKEKEAVRLHCKNLTRIYGGPKAFPETFEAMVALRERYMEEQFRFEPQNQRLSLAVLDWFCGQVPALIRPIFRRLALGLVEPQTLVAVGLPVPTRLERALAHVAMRIVGRRDPLPDGAPNPLNDLAAAVYPGGFTLETLGTHIRPQKTGAQAPPPGCPVHTNSAS